MIISILFIIQEAEGYFNCLLQRTCLLRHSSQALEAWRTRRFDGGSPERLLLSSESDALCLEGIIGALRRAYIKSNLKNKSQTTIADKEEKHLTIIPPLILAYVKEFIGLLCMSSSYFTVFQRFNDIWAHSVPPYCIIWKKQRICTWWIGQWGRASILQEGIRLSPPHRTRQPGQW